MKTYPSLIADQIKPVEPMKEPRKDSLFHFKIIRCTWFNKMCCRLGIHKYIISIHETSCIWCGKRKENRYAK